MEIVVISLPGATDRRESVARQMRSAGLAFRFLDAASGPEAIAAGEFDGIDEDNYVLNCGRRPVPGEIGCFASHRRAWQQCAAAGVPILVMEDDFELRQNFRDAVNAAALVIENAGFVRLQTDLRARKKPVAEVGDFMLARFTKPPHGLMCYAISPAVAQRFVARTHVVDAPVDVFVKKYWDHGQALHALLPYSVGESRHHQVTSIPGRRRQAKSRRVAIRRFCRKAGWQVQRVVWNFARPARPFAAAPEASRENRTSRRDRGRGTN